ncbi:MAG: YceI family protein [Candidatus Obscuribacterales bacterium]
MIRLATALTFVALVSGTLPSFATTYTIDPQHSQAGFSIRHMMLSNVRGAFSKVSGTIDYDPAKPAASKVEAVIDMNSVDTHDANRDKHLKTADFFDTDKYPTMTFKSTKVVPKGKTGLTVTGDLTLHGVTKSVVLNVEGPTEELKDPKGSKRGASGTTKIHRKDFGITYNKQLDNGGVALGEDVDVTIDVEMKAEPASK